MKKIILTAVFALLFIANFTWASQIDAVGEFQGYDRAHDVQGAAALITSTSGEHFMLLSDDFMTTEGPDLVVMLHTDKSPKSFTQNNSYMVARLASDQGLQLYEIPFAYMQGDFKSVVIWCRKFNVIFGIAPLVF